MSKVQWTAKGGPEINRLYLPPFSQLTFHLCTLALLVLLNSKYHYSNRFWPNFADFQSLSSSLFSWNCFTEIIEARKQENLAKWYTQPQTKLGGGRHLTDWLWHLRLSLTLTLLKFEFLQSSHGWVNYFITSRRQKCAF